MTLLRSLRSLPRPVWVAFSATLVNRVGTMALPFFVVYLTDVRRFDPETAGWMLGLYGAGALVAGPAAGALVSRVGARPVMIGSLCGSALALLALPGIERRAGLGLVVVAWALTGEAFRPACATVVAAHVEPERRREAFAVMRFAVNLGMTIGPAVGGFLVARSFRALFFIDAASSLLAAVWLTLPSQRAVDGERSAPLAQIAPGEPRQMLGPLARHLLAVTLVAMVAYQGLSTLPLYLVHDLGLPASAYGGVFAFSGVLILVFEVPLTAAAQRWSHRRLLAIGAILTGIGFGALSVAHSVAMVLGTTVVWSFGEIVLGPAAAAHVSDLEPPGRRGLFLGVYNGVWSAAFALGPLIGTYSLARLGGRVHWIAVGAVGAVAAALFGTSPDKQVPAAQPARGVGRRQS